MPTSLNDFIQQLPKAELHIHLEGCVTPEFWLKLIRKHQPHTPITLPELEKCFQYRSFYDFLETYKNIIFSFQQPDDLYDLTRFSLNKLVSQNVRYVEMMFTPFFFVKRGLDYTEMMRAIDAAAKECEADHPIRMKLIFDGPRNFGDEVVNAVFDMAINDKTGRVIGVGLGGDEKNFPAVLFQNAFKKAAAHGLKLIAHAGETDDETSIANTIELLDVKRIGHGLGITPNGKAARLVEERGIILDLCPGSNRCTQVIPDLISHPFNEYLENGYQITLNSDDPGLFNTDIVAEYQNMANLHQLFPHQLATVSKNAVNGAFLEQSDKQKLIQEIDIYLTNWLNKNPSMT